MHENLLDSVMTAPLKRESLLEQPNPTHGLNVDQSWQSENLDDLRERYAVAQEVPPRLFALVRMLKSPPRPNPSVPRRGTASPTSQSYGRVTAFFSARPRIALSMWRKEGPNTPSNVSRPRWHAFVFCRCRWGTGTAKARAPTTPPLGAENVTHSRKICDAPNSPRFALFYMAML